MSVVIFDISILDRMVRAAERVRDRLRRSTEALSATSIPYALAGDHAVATWVGRVDESALRNCQDVTLLVQPSNIDAAIAALVQAGFSHHPDLYPNLLFDGEILAARHAVTISRAAESGMAGNDFEPSIDDVDRAGPHPVLHLESILRMELARNRALNCVRVRDLIDVELVDATWPAKLPPELAARLQALLDDPDG